MKHLKQLFWISDNNGQHAPQTARMFNKKISRPAALFNLLLVAALWVALFGSPSERFRYGLILPF